MDEMSIIREQVYGAIRSFTSATVAEAEAATKAIIRIVDNALPDDGSCVRCGAAPRNASGLCATCVDEDAERAGEVESNYSIAVMRDAYVALSFAFSRLHSSGRSRDTELCSDFGKVRGRIEAVFKSTGEKL